MDCTLGGVDAPGHCPQPGAAHTATPSEYDLTRLNPSEHCWTKSAISRDFSGSEHTFFFEARHDCWVSPPQNSFPKWAHWTSLPVQEEVYGAGVQGHWAQALIWVGWLSGNKCQDLPGRPALGRSHTLLLFWGPGASA